jgi:hypothetical protein
MAGGGVVDSGQTDRRGRYELLVSSPDTSAEYFVSVEHDDIGYFSSALHLAREGADSVPTIVVYETSYADPDVELQERHIIVRSQDVDGTRQIIELIALRNAGRLTRIAADTSTPSWQGVLPVNAFQLAIGESEVGSGAVYGRGNYLAVAAPIPPGQKQILFSYIVPRVGDLLEFPIDQPTARLTISVEDTTATASGSRLALYGIEDVSGVLFKRYDATGVPAGTSISVQFETPFVSVARLKFVVIFLAVVALAGTLAWWMRRNAAQNSG